MEKGAGHVWGRGGQDGGTLGTDVGSGCKEQGFEREQEVCYPLSYPTSASRLADAPKGVRVLLSPAGRNILPGDLVTLTCQVNSSYPGVSSMQWLKDGELLKADGPVLQLSQAAWSDAGVYTCKAGNSVGSSVSPPVSLHVFSESWARLDLARG